MPKKTKSCQRAQQISTASSKIESLTTAISSGQLSEERLNRLKLKVKAHFPALLFAQLTQQAQTQSDICEDLAHNLNYLQQACQILKSRSKMIHNDKNEYLWLQCQWVLNNNAKADKFVNQQQAFSDSSLDKSQSIDTGLLEGLRQILTPLEARVSLTNDNQIRLIFQIQDNIFEFDIEPYRLWDWLNIIEYLPTKGETIDAIDTINQKYMPSLLALLGSSDGKNLKTMVWHGSRFSFNVLPGMFSDNGESYQGWLASTIIKNNDMSQYEFMLLYLAQQADNYLQNLKSKQRQYIQQGDELAKCWQNLVADIDHCQQQRELTVENGEHERVGIFDESETNPTILQSGLTRVSQNEQALLPTVGQTSYHPSVLSDSIVSASNNLDQAHIEADSIEPGESLESQLNNRLQAMKKDLANAEQEQSNWQQKLTQLSHQMDDLITEYNDLNLDINLKHRDQEQFEKMHRNEERVWQQDAMDLAVQENDHLKCLCQNYADERRELTNNIHQLSDASMNLYEELSRHQVTYDSLNTPYYSFDPNQS